MEQKQNYGILWSTRNQQGLSTLSTKNFARGKREQKEAFPFGYQSSWQKYFLNPYGQEMILLDTSYKTTRYLSPCENQCRQSSRCYFCHWEWSTEHGDITLLYLHVLSKYQRCCLLQDHGTHQWIHVTVWVIIITKRLLHWRVYSQVSVLIGNFLNVLNRWLQSKEREKWDPI